MMTMMMAIMMMIRMTTTAIIATPPPELPPSSEFDAGSAVCNYNNIHCAVMYCHDGIIPC